MQPFHSVIAAPKHSQTIHEGMGVAVFKKKNGYLQKQKAGWIWPANDSLWIPGPENSELSNMVAPCST